MGPDRARNQDWLSWRGAAAVYSTDRHIARIMEMNTYMKDNIKSDLR
jgi:hypothetical protein